MDKSIIQDFARLRVLTPYRRTMDELVQDLTNALEESSKAAAVAAADSAGHQLGQHGVKIKRRGNRKRRPMSSALKLSPRIKGLLSPTRLSCTDASSLLLACSEDSVSSLDESGARKSRVIEAPHSDSDCNGPSVSGRPVAVARVFAQSSSTSGHHLPAVGSFAESDSVNENFSPVRPHRRKRKFKRMAVDPSEGPVVQLPVAASPVQFLGHRSQHRKPLARACGALVEGECSCIFTDALIKSPILTSGKRKHSMRERSLELMEASENDALLEAGRSLESVVISDTPFELADGSPSLRTTDTNMEEEGGGSSSGGATCVIVDNGDSNSSSSSSGGGGGSGLSGSESDAGIYTNDEGREGDDEQSDFYHEGELDGGGPACGIPGVFPWWETQQHPLEYDEEDETFRSILNGSFRHMSVETRRAFENDICKLTSLRGREIRAGRRRLRDRRPGFSIISSMNERISKFLQNPDQNELRLCPMKRKEMNQLGHLASLYSLNMRSDGPNQDKCPILTKTRNTTQVVNLDKIGVNSLWNGGQRWTVANAIKRCRRTPPICTVADDFVGDGRASEPIPEHNLGNQMLREMGWEPGHGLGPDRDGIKTPIMAQIRPRYLGLGFGPSISSKASPSDR